jgi:hypothetical protein
VDKWGRKFGFVKFSEVEELVDLESRLKDVWLGKVHLKVNKARFGRNEQKGDGVGTSMVGAAKGGGVVGLESAAKTPPFSWDRSHFPELKKELPCLDILPSEEMVQFLEQCYVAELHLQTEPMALQQLLVMDGINRVKVTTMGDKWMLLFFEGGIDVEAVRINHKNGWDSMFKSVRCWSPQLVAKSRMVWLNVHGIPLHVWDEPIFKKIGDLFGKFIDFDEDTIGRRRLDVARIRVSIVRKGLVDEILKIKVVGTIFSLWVVEEGGGHRRRGKW